MGKLFDIEESRRRREEGIERVRKHAHKQWKADAFFCGMLVCADRQFLTADHVHEKLAELFPDSHTHEPRAMGAVMRDLQKSGLISLEGVTKSERPIAHRAHHALWSSTHWEG